MLFKKSMFINDLSGRYEFAPAGVFTVVSRALWNSEYEFVLRDEISSALKSSMKEKDPVAVSTLRLIQAAIKDRDIAARSRASTMVFLMIRFYRCFRPWFANAMSR